jgi:hypothetical protein
VVESGGGGAQAAELLAIWRNPVFERFRRSRLRLRKSIFWLLLTLIVATYVVALTYIVRTNIGVSPATAARGLWFPLLIIQGLILLFKGTGAVAAGLIQDKVDQTLDYQRLTPVTPLRNVLGYLFGLPVLEYAMLALTLPHLFFIAVVGAIPLSALASVYSAFFMCAILYHITAIAAGMVMRRWVLGYLLSILLVIFLNIVLPVFISQLGLKFLQYLSLWPVIAQEVVPVSFQNSYALVSGNPFFTMAGDVPFFDWRLSPYAFTLLLQAALILTFGTMTLRRWKSSSRHSLSKPYALGIVCGFVVLFLGNLWPVISGSYMPFALFGSTNIEQLGDVLGVALPLVYCLAVWFLCLVLFGIVTPSHHAYVRGIRRAFKHGRNAARPWDDDAANVPFMGLFVLVALVGYWILWREVTTAGFLDFLGPAGLRGWRLPLALGLVLLNTFLLLQVLELKLSALVILLLWFLPILAASVFSAAVEGFATAQAMLASLSPLALVALAGLVPLQAIADGNMNDEIAAAHVGVYTGLAFIVLQTAALWLRWRRIRVTARAGGETC